MTHLFDQYVAFWRRNQKLLMIALVLTVTAMTFAQTATPTMAQTATPVPIEIPTGDMMVHLNTWLGVFAPIVLLFGMIPVALGLLRYITKLFQQAFTGGGGR